MKLQKILSYGLIGIFFLSSCAVTYGPKDALGGYSEDQIDETSALVAFEGNQHNSVGEIRTYLTYRCSEFTLEKGFTHFLIMEDESFVEGGEKEFLDSDMTFETRTSMSGGTNTSVRSNYGAQDGTGTPIGIFKIKMMRGVDPVYISASMDAQTFIDANKHLIKKKK